MKTTNTSLVILMASLIAIQVNAQQLFRDSGQKLGNSCSWDAKLGDLDNDGDLDAVVANYDWNPGSTQKNEIWLNDGKGNFSIKSQELGSTSSVILFDINSDNNLDIIAEGNAYLNNGTADFTLSNQYAFKGSTILFDKNLNNDNKYQAVTIQSGDSSLLRFYSLENCKAAKDSFWVKGLSGITMAIGDLNNDSFSDIVLGQSGPNTGPTFILINNKKGRFEISNQKLGNYISSNIYLKDINADGYLDLLQCNYHTPDGVPFAIYPAQLYLNDGTGNFTLKTIAYNLTYITPDASILDLDNDGDMDIYLNHGHRSADLSRKSEILFNDGQGNFSSSTVNLTLVPTSATVFGDLDQDGDLDAFLACGIFNGTNVGAPDKVWLNTTNDTTVSINKLNTEEIKIFPNPTSGIIHFTSIDFQKDVTIKIFNITSKQLVSMPIQNLNSTTIDLKDFSKGIYLLNLNLGDRMICRKICIE
jgi:hypothetical protein